MRRQFVSSMAKVYPSNDRENTAQVAAGATIEKVFQFVRQDENIANRIKLQTSIPPFLPHSEVDAEVKLSLESARQK